MRVPTMSIAIMAFTMVLGVVFPIALMIFVKKRYHLGLKPFFIGCLTMFLFAFILEQIAHAAVLGSPAGAVIQNNVWLLAAYGALMAGIFEETGRFLTMKFTLRKEHSDDHNAIMYGIGHGGIEMAVILTLGMVNNLVYSLLINGGQAETLLAPLDAASQETLRGVFQELADSPSYMFLLGTVERLAAITAQVSLSVLVWIAVTRTGKKFLYVLAIFLHFLLDAVAVVLSGYGVSVWLIEVVVWGMALAYAALAVKAAKVFSFS